MTDPHDIPQVEPSQVAQEMETGAIFVLDVREGDEWDAGHIEGATHMALSALQLGALPSDKPIVTVCKMGGRSQRAAEEIAASGLDVANMTGGMKAWEQQNQPFIDANGKPGQVI